MGFAIKGFELYSGSIYVLLGKRSGCTHSALVKGCYSLRLLSRRAFYLSSAPSHLTAEVIP